MLSIEQILRLDRSCCTVQWFFAALTNSEIFWSYQGPQTQNYMDPHIYFLHTTLEQCDTVNCIHFLTQLYWL